MGHVQITWSEELKPGHVQSTYTFENIDSEVLADVLDKLASTGADNYDGGTHATEYIVRKNPYNDGYSVLMWTPAGTFDSIYNGTLSKCEQLSNMMNEALQP